MAHKLMGPKARGAQTAAGKMQGQNLASETEAKLRPTQMGLSFDSEQKAVANRLLHTFFIAPEKWENAINSELAKCPENQREHFLKWLARSPFSRTPSNWSREDIPRFLRGKVDTPLDELRYRLELFISCCDPTAERSVVEHTEQKHTLLEFPGAVTFIDQSNSTKMARGKGAKELSAVTDWMHLYLRAASIPFRTMKDVLVGDALSGVNIAPEGNMVACATDAARFLVTVRAFFRLHNEIVDYELEHYGHSRSTKINVRSALALSDPSLGNIVINKNDLQPLAVCDVMNFAARISGVPQEGQIIVSKEARKHLNPFFILERIDPGESIKALLRKTEEGLEPLMHSSPKNKAELMQKLELLYTAARLNYLLFDIFERPNIKDADMEKEEPPFLSQKELYMREFEKAAVEGLKGKIVTEGEYLDGVQQVKFDVEREFAKEQYSKRPKFKGYDEEQLNELYILVDYRTFRSDRMSAPPTSRFESLYLHRLPAEEREQMTGAEKNADDMKLCAIEQFVDDVAKAYGIPTKTNFNPLASAYVMYTMQMTGAPTFAYNVATRAAGVMLYTLEHMQKNWGRQPDQYLTQLQGKLVDLGVFDGEGNINEEKLKDYLAKDVILPALSAEFGLMKMFDDREQFDAFLRTEATARLMGRKIYYVNQEQGEDVADDIINMHLVSRSLLEGMNARCRESGNPEPIPQETLSVLERISFSEKNRGIEAANGDEHDLAAQAIVMCRIIETDRHRKAFESERPPQNWVSIYDDDIKGTNGVVYPHLATVFRELFLLTADGKRVKGELLQ